MSRSNISNHLRNKERTELRSYCIFCLSIAQYFFFECVDTTDTYSKDYTNLIAVFFFWVKICITYSFFSSCNGVLCIEVHFTSFFAVDKIGCIEVLNLTRKLCFKFRCIKMSNRPCSTYSIQQIVPEFWSSVAYRGECTKTCYYYSF